MKRPLNQLSLRKINLVKNEETGIAQRCTKTQRRNKAKQKFHNQLILNDYHQSWIDKNIVQNKKKNEKNWSNQVTNRTTATFDFPSMGQN